MQRLITLITQDPMRMGLLKTVASLNLPDCWVAAGFVRNMVWDHLHGFAVTALNDVDVIFFDKADVANVRAKEAHRVLEKVATGVHWQVKNQAFMHVNNQDTPYENSLDAMSYWPEKETAVGVRLDESGVIEVATSFGLDSLFAGLISHNPKRDETIFLKRLHSKEWLTRWPNLKLGKSQLGKSQFGK